MPDTDELLSTAVYWHRAGDLQQAWQAYQRVLQLDSAHGAALNGAGLLLRQSGRYEEAVEYCRKAIAADSNEAAYYANLGEAHRGLGQLFEGLECYREAARLAPDEFAVHYNRATLCAQAGMHDEAMSGYQRALELRPHPGAQHALGGEYQRQGRLAEAAECYRRALVLEPAHKQAAIDLAALLQAEGRIADAIACLEAAVAHHPDDADAQCRLGSALFDDGRLAEARERFERAIEIDPAQEGLYYNLGSVLLARSELPSAIQAFDRAIELRSDYPEARCSRGTARLAAGDFAGGWADFEDRLRVANSDVPRVSQPRWDGSDLQARTLLVYGEQGFGDTLQFVRYVPLAREKGRVILAVRPPLVRLLGESGLGEVVSSEEELPAFDLFAPLLSLPRIFDTKLESIPCDVPYLSIDGQRRDQWRERLDAHRGLRVGIAWQGATHFRNDHLRSVPLAAMAPLAEVPGVALFSLQKGPGREQLAQAAFRLHVVDLADSLADFADTAAIVANLDLVITCDTAVAHLAGALARPVWVAISAAPDWRWMLAREDSPWYPTMRLFRQQMPGQWGDVFSRMAAELAERASREDLKARAD